MNKWDWNNSERLFTLKYKQKLINYSSCLSHTAGFNVDTATTHTVARSSPFSSLEEVRLVECGE